VQKTFITGCLNKTLMAMKCEESKYVDKAQIPRHKMPHRQEHLCIWNRKHSDVVNISNGGSHSAAMPIKQPLIHFQCP